LKLDCPKKEFGDAVSMANAAASTRTALSILQSLKIEAHDGGLRVMGCDGEMWVERNVACMVHEPGAVCVQARLLNELIGTLPDGDIQLYTLPEQGLMVQQGNSEYRVLSLEAEDFPEPPDYGGEGELTLTMGEFRSAVDSVMFAVSGDTHRQVLTGVLFSYNGHALTLVATDTHRLAVRHIDREGIGTNIAAVVPEKALKAMKGLPLGDDSSITIRYGVGRVGVDAGGARVVSQLLAGAYPNWERVVPAGSNRCWSVEVDQLSEKLKRANILARDNANRVRFAGQGDQILISAKSEEKGEAKEEVPMVAENGDLEIAFNGRYVLDALGAIHGDGVRIELSESTKPAVFRPADSDNDGYFCVIMPMALA
jgi:DNA polymerase-3 subunit beta